MKRAVVTGASGFIGRALTKRLLADGWTVYAVVRGSSNVGSHEGLHVVEAEMADYERLDRLTQERCFDAFFHLAWDGTFGESFRDYHRQMRNTAYAGDALLAAVRLGAKRFVLASTIVGLEAKHYMLSDGGQPRVSCIYGTAKAAGEMLCRTLAYQNRMAFNTAVLASVYGDGDHSGMIQNVLIRALQKGECPKLVSGGTLYDWIYVEDVAAGLAAVAERGKPDKTYYIGHWQLRPFGELVTRTRDIVAPEVELIFGTLEDTTATDWSLIDRDALYRDTGFVCTADFDESIRKTARWLAGEDNMTKHKTQKSYRGGVTPSSTYVFVVSALSAARGAAA